RLRKSSRFHYCGDCSLHNIKYGKHKLHTVSNRSFCKSKAYKQLQGVFRFLNFRKTAASAYHTYYKKQHKQGKTNRLYRTVDIDNYSPYTSAFKILRRSCNKLPNFSKFLIPSFKGVLEILNNPVTTQFCYTSLIKYEALLTSPGTPL